MSRKLQEIDKLLGELNSALESHYQWLVEVFRYISVRDIENPEITSENSHQVCQLGTWLNRQLLKKSENKGFILTIHQHHEDTHQICRELVTSIINKQANLELFNEFQASLQKLIMAIISFQRHLLQLRISHDALTGLPLRRILDESFAKQVLDDSNGQLYVLIIDIDHFKRINDTYGHLVGDAVLRAFATKLQHCTRHYEPAYRFGGEEFIVILKAHRDEDACATGLRLTQIIEQHEIIVPPFRLNLTVTCGLTKARPGEVLHSVLERADEAMYLGKQSGRNRCMFADEKGKITLIAH